MAEIVVFHHAHGVTDGIRAFCDSLRAAGHAVHCPDLFDGATFDTVEEGVAHAESLGFEAIIDAGVEYAQGLPANLVYAGFSLGILPAQKLAQTEPGARGALLYHDALPAPTFGGPWPDGVALQIHVTEDDPWSERDGVEELHRSVDGSELYLYPGDAHLFADESLAEYDAQMAGLLMMRTLALLDRLD